MKYFTITNLIGASILLINVFWILFFGNLLYEYHFTSIMFLYMLPDWLLIINLIIGLTGIIIGIRLIKNKFAVWKALIIDTPLLTIGLLLTWIIPM